MNIIIPIGGTGQRFKENGYNLPKPLIKALGKEIIRWVIDSLPKNTNIYIAYNKDLDFFNFSNFLKEYYPFVKCFPLYKDTIGSSETVKICLEKYFIDKDEPFITIDCDSFVDCDFNNFYGKNCVVCFKSQEDVYSYYLTENNIITKIAEKKVISDNAACGIYSFASSKKFLYYYNEIHSCKEYYISTIIQQMLSEQFTVYNVPKESFKCLGTPFHLRCFCNREVSQSIRICFDLDNTLVTPPLVPGDYSTCQPIQKNIEFCQFLKELGHTIIIYTARRMKTHNGNTGKLMKDIGKITFDTLSDLSIPFDEIYFGKPYADIYIDDKCIDPNFLDLKSGFYNKTIEPRNFNQLIKNENTITKISKDLTSEIHYYNNLPIELLHFFPKMLSYNFPTTYTIEKIDGITISEIITSQGYISSDIFNTIIESLKKFHEIKCPNVNFDIKDVYSRKLKERNIVPCSNLLEYESNVQSFTCIHGDPVFTNIMINSHGKIKFIDPRGHIGTINTIYGDPLYDWAKVYQSIIGYDFILMNKPIKIDLNILNIFEKSFSDVEIRNIKIICRSLIQSLIPLHEKNHIEFENLFKSIIIN